MTIAMPLPFTIRIEGFSTKYTHAEAGFAAND